MISPQRMCNGILLLALFALPLVAQAQAPSLSRVGVLSPGKPPPDDAFRQQEHFEAGLRELGWTPGSNILVEYRYANGNLDRLPALAAELVRVPVNVIVARGLTIRAARDAAQRFQSSWRLTRIPCAADSSLALLARAETSRDSPRSRLIWKPSSSSCCAKRFHH